MIDLDSLSDIEEIISFGKYRGNSLKWVAENDARYLEWFRNGTDYGRENTEQIDEALAAARLAKVTAAPPIDLTEHQEERAEIIRAGIADGNNVLRLDGGAGYGKSYVTQDLAADAIRNGMTVRAMAVSYVATQVLAEQLEPLGVECGTCARMMRFTVRHEGGVEIYEHSENTYDVVAEMLRPGNMLIVDEASMVSDRDAAILIETARDLGGVLVLVGDAYQLPPVKQEHLSMCCLPDTVDVTATLTKPMRYSEDSHLFQIEQAARANPSELVYGSSGVLLPSSELTVARTMEEVYARYMERYRDDPVARHRMLLFRRDDVNAANNAIRDALYGPGAGIVEEDEQLMILRTGDTPANEDNAIRYYSGQIYRVLDKTQALYEIRIGDADFRIPHYRVRFDNNAPAVRVVFGITEATMDTSKLGGLEYQRALSAAQEYGRGLGEWGPYRQLLDDFVRVAYTYATSVHRAQGQTVDYSYCSPRALMTVRGLMGNALTYVAMTRARKHLTVF